MRTIQDLRETYGWSHYELAIRLGVRPVTIRDWESGKSSPRSIHIRRLAEVFGVKQDFIDLGVQTTIDQSRDAR